MTAVVRWCLWWAAHDGEQACWAGANRHLKHSRKYIVYSISSNGLARPDHLPGTMESATIHDVTQLDKKWWKSRYNLTFAHTSHQLLFISPILLLPSSSMYMPFVLTNPISNWLWTISNAYLNQLSCRLLPQSSSFCWSSPLPKLLTLSSRQTHSNGKVMINILLNGKWVLPDQTVLPSDAWMIWRWNIDFPSSQVRTARAPSSAYPSYIPIYLRFSLWLIFRRIMITLRIRLTPQFHPEMDTHSPSYRPTTWQFLRQTLR